MRLRKRQKEALLQWIAEGLRTDEINQRGAEFKQPFHVTTQQVDGYRKRRAIVLSMLTKQDEESALNNGLALKENRVIALQRLARLLELDIFESDLLWIEDVKGVGNGTAAEIVDYDRFNSAEVDAFRGVLDDLAAETGGRVKKQEFTGAEGKPLLDADAVGKALEKIYGSKN